MSEPTGAAARCLHDSRYCCNCDRLLGLDGLHVVAVDRDPAGQVLRLVVESPPGPMGCPTCGVIAHSRGRRTVRLIDAPCFGRPVRLLWRKRTWRCLEPGCPTRSFTEQDDQIAPARALLTTRACWWAINQIRREHASVLGLARQLGCAWATVWTAIKPLLEAMAADESRFAGVQRLGVDEHVWHHGSTRPREHGGRGPKEFTGMTDLTPDQHGRPQTRLLDLVLGRSGKVYDDWLVARGKQFKAGVKEATLDPFTGYKRAIDDHLEDAVAILDAFHVVKLGTDAVDEVRRRLQQTIHGHRGRKGDPLYGIRNILRAGVDKLTEKQKARLERAIAADARHDEVYIAWQCAQQLRAAYAAEDLAAGRRIAEQILATFPTCPIPEIKRLGKTLTRWRPAFLAYWSTGRASNGPTEAINGLIELHRRIARGIPNPEHYRLRMLLIGGGLSHPHLI